MKASPRTLGAVMSSEAGLEPEVNDAPLRVTGFLSLLLALIGGFTIVALPMVGFCIAAVLLGLFALRKSDSQLPPVGTTAARVGIVLAVLFGVWGTSRFAFKYQTLANQAEYFARQFVKVASSDDDLYARELQKNYVNRYLKTMPLEERYELEREEQERLARQAEAEGRRYSPPEEDTTLSDLKKYPVDHPWRLWRPVRIYHHYGRQMAEVILASSDAEDGGYRLRLELEYLVHKDRGSGEWHVEVAAPYYEPIVAESVL